MKFFTGIFYRHGPAKARVFDVLPRLPALTSRPLALIAGRDTALSRGIINRGKRRVYNSQDLWRWRAHGLYERILLRPQVFSL